MTLRLPFVEKGSVDLTRKGEELIVKAGSFKRNIMLPRVLLHLTVTGARFDGDQLRITFAK